MDRQVEVGVRCLRSSDRQGLIRSLAAEQPDKAFVQILPQSENEHSKVVRVTCGPGGCKTKPTPRPALSMAINTAAVDAAIIFAQRQRRVQIGDS